MGLAYSLIGESMSWYINDISLAGQYQTPVDFIADLKQLLVARNQIPLLAAQLYCSRSVHCRPVSPNCDFQRAVINSGDRSLIALVLNWLSKAGPFWEDSRQHVADDYFEYEGTDVTDQGLGEVARRLLSGSAGSTYSFARTGFDKTPLHVVHGLPEAPFGALDVHNFWEIAGLRLAAEDATPPPQNWNQMLNKAQDQFEQLNLIPSCIEPLIGEPFNRYVVERVNELLGVLNEYVTCFSEAGDKTDRNHELLTQHFTGEKAWFSDESETNKQKFRSQMTFIDPCDSTREVFCPWHGKIKTPQYRIHFEWPPRLRERLRVFYIGPKITKS